MTNPVIGVIEWSSDSATEPAVFLADSVTAVRAAVAQYLTPMAGDIDYIDAAWIAGHPAPVLGDAEAVETWLDDLRAATTDAWLTIYTGSDSPTSDTYADLRGDNGIPGSPAESKRSDFLRKMAELRKLQADRRGGGIRDIVLTGEVLALAEELLA